MNKWQRCRGEATSSPSVLSWPGEGEQAALYKWAVLLDILRTPLWTPLTCHDLWQHHWGVLHWECQQTLSDGSLFQYHNWWIVSPPMQTIWVSSKTRHIVSVAVCLNIATINNFFRNTNHARAMCILAGLQCKGQLVRRDLVRLKGQGALDDSVTNCFAYLLGQAAVLT